MSKKTKVVRKPTKSSKSSKIRAYFMEYPTAPSGMVARKFGVNSTVVAGVRYNLRKAGKLPNPIVPSVPKDEPKRIVDKKEKDPRPLTTEFCLKVAVPPAGLKLQLTNQNGNSTGTMYFSETGIKFVGANAKLMPERELSYRVLNGIMISGLLD